MFPQYALFGMASSCLLWMLSVVGGIAVLLSWIYIEPEYDEECLLTRGSHCSVRARALLTVSCMVFWICTFLGHALTGTSDITFGFWQHHPALLATPLFLVDMLLIASVIFAWQARGSGRWILWIATPIITLASLVGSIVLYLP
jgi:uncharacterized membrane protein